MQESKTIVAGSGAQVHELVRQEGMFRILGLMTAIPKTRTSQPTTREIGQDFDENARRWSWSNQPSMADSDRTKSTRSPRLGSAC
jgi:hypothetical protein